MALAESGAAAALYRDRAAAAGLADRLEIRVQDAARIDGPPGRYGVVYSVNALHTWADPAAVLARPTRLLAPGGVLLVSDLRRDADPFITEYVLRELAQEPGPEGEYRARTFAESLASALTVDELTAALAAWPGPHPPRRQVAPDGAMAVTIRIWRD